MQEKETGYSSPFTWGPAPAGFVGPTVGSPKKTPIPLKTTPTAPTNKITNRASGPVVGSNNTGVISPTAPVNPTVDDWIAGDTAYKSQSDQLAKAWADYQAQQGIAEGQYRNTYTNDTNALATTKEAAAKALEDDYASRGLLGSGLYAGAYNDFQTDYGNRQKALDTGLSDFLSNLALQGQNFKSEQDIATEKARQDALARRAASIGL